MTLPSRSHRRRTPAPARADLVAVERALCSARGDVTPERVARLVGLPHRAVYAALYALHAQGRAAPHVDALPTAAPVSELHTPWRWVGARAVAAP